MSLHPTTDRTSWGGIVREPCHSASARFADEVPALVRKARQQAQSVLGVGLGRSYGDAAPNSGNAIIDTHGLDRLIGFDPQTSLMFAGLTFFVARRLRREPAMARAAARG